MAKKLSSPWQWGIQVVCLVLAAIVYFVFEKVVFPFKRGFFCNDESIRYPAKANAITFSAVLGVGLAITVPTIVVVRMYNNLLHYGTFRPPLIPTLKDILTMAFGAFASQGTLDIIKVIVGRLRPSFISVCFGNNMTNVADLCAEAGDGAYVTDFECTCSDKDEREARLSFPSGHTSFMVFTVMFTICYLQRKSCDRWIKLLLATIQLLYLNVAIAISMSRISNYKHHPTDVLSGAFLGSVAGYFAAYYLLEEDPRNEAATPLRKNGHDDVETNYTNVAQNEREAKAMQP